MHTGYSILESNVVLRMRLHSLFKMAEHVSAETIANTVSNTGLKSLVSSSDESDSSQDSDDDEGLIEDDTGETQSLLTEDEALNERNISISSGLSTYSSLSS